VVLLIIHRKDIAAVASKHSFGRGHEDTTLYLYFLVIEQCRERFGMYTDRLVGFVKDGKIERYPRLSRRRSQLATALISREYNFRSTRADAKQCRNLIRISMRGQTEVIGLAYKSVPLKVSDCFIAANAKPIRFNAMSKTLTGPIA